MRGTRKDPRLGLAALAGVLHVWGSVSLTGDRGPESWGSTPAPAPQGSPLASDPARSSARSELPLDAPTIYERPRPAPTMPRRPTLPPITPRSVSVSPPDVPPALSGVASWYCNSDSGRGPTSRCTRGHPDRAGCDHRTGTGCDYFAAVRRNLLYLRGQEISVCAGQRCVAVTVIDCNCGPHANLIDLYADAFEALSPIGAGRIKVRVVP